MTLEKLKSSKISVLAGTQMQTIRGGLKEEASKNLCPEAAIETLDIAVQVGIAWLDTSFQRLFLSSNRPSHLP